MSIDGIKNKKIDSLLIVWYNSKKTKREKIWKI